MKTRSISPARVIAAFERYMHEEGGHITRAMFEENLLAKQRDPVFTADLAPLIATGHTWRFDEAFDLVWSELISQLPGDPWKGGR